MKTRSLMRAAAVTVLAPPAVLGVEAALALRRGYADPGTAPLLELGCGPADGEPVSLTLFGDSTAAGLGVERVEDTVGGQLARTLAGAGHRVELRGYAVSGARVRDLIGQVDRRAPRPADPSVRRVAVVLIGANDATHLTPLGRLTDDLTRALARLAEDGAAVVLATCPDLGAARALPQPLRELIGRRGRAVAAAERAAAARAAASCVSGSVGSVDLAVTGRDFRRHPARLSPDLFHPSAEGYARWAQTLAPAVLEAAARP